MNTCQIKPFRLNIGGTYFTALLSFPYTSDLNHNQLLKPDPSRLSYGSKHSSDTAVNPSLLSPPNPPHSHHPVGFCTPRVSNNFSLARRPRSPVTAVISPALQNCGSQPNVSLGHQVEEGSLGVSLWLINHQTTDASALQGQMQQSSGQSQDLSSVTLVERDQP